MSEAILKEDVFPQGLKEVMKQQEDTAVSRAKEYLSRYSRLNQRIDQKLRFRTRLWDLTTRTTGDPFAVTGREWEDGRAAAVQRMVDLDQEIDRDIDHLRNLKNEIWSVLSRMENPEISLLLDDLYMEGLNIPQAAARSGYSIRHTYKLQRWGLIELDRILQEERPMCGYVSPL